MHIFLLAWNCGTPITRNAKSCLTDMQLFFPHLDLETLWQRQVSPQLFLTSIHLSEQLSAKRLYRHVTDQEVTLFDGCPVDTQRKFPAHRADEASRHWDKLSQYLEGQYVYIKATTNPESLEVITDPLGVYQVYQRKIDNGFVISNSVYLIEQVTGNASLDELGVSLYLSMGWAGSDRTLLKNIKTISGGSRIKFTPEQIEPILTRYFSRHHLKPSTHQLDVPSTAKELANIVSLTSEIDRIECPITAGRDSRVMVAILNSQNISADYFSEGLPGTVDVDIGQNVARHLGLNHHLLNRAVNQTEQQWDDAIFRILMQTDGMGTLAHVDNGLRHSPNLDHYKIHYYGAGGEIARSFWFKRQTHLFITKPGINTCSRILKTSLINNRTQLINANTLSIFNLYIDNYAQSLIGDGFGAMDIERLFYLEQRVGRWVGTNFKQVNDYVNVFSPFCTRPFTLAAFTLSPLQHYAEILHYQLIAELEPDLLTLPMESPWQNQSTKHLYKDIVMEFINKRLIQRIQNRLKFLDFTKVKRHSSLDIATKRNAWLEDRLATFRCFCLDQHYSEIWNYVDKKQFEELTHPATPPADRAKYSDILYDVITLFCYEYYRHDIKGKVSLLAK